MVLIRLALGLLISGIALPSMAAEFETFAYGVVGAYGRNNERDVTGLACDFIDGCFTATGERCKDDPTEPRDAGGFRPGMRSGASNGLRRAGDGYQPFGRPRDVEETCRGSLRDRHGRRPPTARRGEPARRRGSSRPTAIGLQLSHHSYALKHLWIPATPFPDRPCSIPRMPS